MLPSSHALLSNTLHHRWTRHFWLAALCVGAGLLVYSSLPYLSDDEYHPFIVEKLPLPNEDMWLRMLNIHVPSALFALPACTLLLSRRLLRAWPRVHRYLGRVTGAVILLAVVPSGAYLALDAKGGLPSTVGFMLSGAIVAVAMIWAIVAARAREFVRHRQCIVHVVAQLSVAVTSRAMLFAFGALGVDADLAYSVALWVPVVGSAVVAQLVLTGRGARSSLAALGVHDASLRIDRWRLSPVVVRRG